jgi:hypothetical protein
MKSLVLALIFFGVVMYGCFDVKPYRAIRKLVRRPSKAGPGSTAPLAGPAAPAPEDERPLTRRYR